MLLEKSIWYWFLLIEMQKDSERSQTESEYGKSTFSCYVSVWLRSEFFCISIYGNQYKNDFPESIFAKSTKCYQKTQFCIGFYCSKCRRIPNGAKRGQKMKKWISIFRSPQTLSISTARVKFALHMNST